MIGFFSSQITGRISLIRKAVIKIIIVTIFIPFLSISNNASSSQDSVAATAGISLTPFLGMTYGHRFNPRNSLQIESLYGEDSSSKSYSEKSFSLGSSYRISPLDGTFHFGLGGLYLHRKQRQTIEGFVSSSSGDPKRYEKWQIIYAGKADEIHLELFLGNEWNFDSGFLIGCDWLGYSRRVFLLSNKTSVVSEVNRPAGWDDSIERKNVSYKNSHTTFYVLKTHIGWKF
jgi:hypothetical protein